MKKHMQAATTAHFRKMNMGGVSLLLFKTVVFLATMFSTTIIIAEPRSVDVYTGSMSVSELQVDNNAVNYNWDINRIYAVSNSSNSGKNILSALYNGTDIVYKVSANSASYKQGNTTGIIHNPGKASVRLYPNPAHDNLTIAGADNSAYEIHDMTGKLMLKGYNKGSSIDIRHLPAGFYVMKLQQDKKPSQTLKFTKQ